LTILTGAEVMPSINKKTTLLIVGGKNANMNSTKLKQSKAMNIEVWSEEEWLKNVK